MAFFAYLTSFERCFYAKIESFSRSLLLGQKMNFLNSLQLIALSWILVSCSTISREDCKKDMKEMGFSQGRKGLTNLTDEIRKVCIRSNSTVDLEGYAKSFEKGWSEFCTPMHGFESGKRGDIYKSYCPPEKENLFREKFLIGKRVYEKNDQVNELEEKIKDLTPAAEHDLATKEHLQKIQNYTQGLKREIQALEQLGMNPVHKDY